MRTNEAVQFVFEGSIRSDSFVGFARHRAARLDLHLTLGPCQDDRVALAIRGQNDLVDAFEMACSLGPQDCIVHDVHRIGGTRD